MAITTRDGEAALRWLLDNWDDATQVTTAGPQTKQKLGEAREALVGVVQSEDWLRSAHAAARVAAPMTPEEFAEVLKCARMMLDFQLAPSPSFVIGFARALVQLAGELEGVERQLGTLLPELVTR